MPPEPTPEADRPALLLSKRIRELFRRVPGALGGEEESLHRMRVASRRLRVALPLLARKSRSKRVRRARKVLRALTRTGGRSRDLDVALSLLEQRLQTTGSMSPEEQTLRRRLRMARGRSRSRLAGALLDQDIAGLRRDLRRLGSRPPANLFTVLGRLRDQRDRLGHRLLSRLEALGTRLDPEALHGIRITARRLRYVAEVADTLVGAGPEPAARFKEFQERLGQLHDAYVLERWLAALVRRAEAKGEWELAAVARREQAHFSEDCRVRHAAFLQEDPVARAREALEQMGRDRSAA